MSHLRYLTCSFDDINYGNFAREIEVIRSNTELESLKFVGSKLSARQVKELVNSLILHRNLERLTLMSNNLETDEIKTIISLSLTGLSLSCCMIDDEKVVILSRSLMTNKTLKYLDLSHNKITDEGVSALSEMLKANTTLETFILSNNRIGAIGLDNIAKNIFENSSIAHLDLDYNYSPCRQRQLKLYSVTSRNFENKMRREHGLFYLMWQMIEIKNMWGR